MSKVKVAFFIDVLKEHFDGVSNTMHQIIRRIPKDEFEVIIITPHPPDNDVGFPVFQCPYVPMVINKGYRYAMPGWMKNLRKILDEFDPDIVHWTSPSKLGKYAINYAAGKSLPVSSIYHTHYPTYTDYYIGFLPGHKKIATFFLDRFFYNFYQDTDAVFVPTRSMFDHLKEHGITKEKLIIWGRGVDMTRFNTSFRDERLFGSEIQEGYKKILFVSRLVKEKETDTLIRLYKLIEKDQLPYKLIITGSGPDQGRMEKQMPEAIFTGMQKGESLARTYASADIFVFPSVTETFGNVVLEAMASGLPVIAADAGGPSDIIDHNERGLLVEPQNEHAFLNAINSVFEDINLYEKIKKNALDYAVRQSWKTLCEELFSTYKALVGVKG